jgi:hypothetical protein
MIKWINTLNFITVNYSFCKAIYIWYGVKSRHYISIGWYNNKKIIISKGQ